jgi:hypothetical protein
MSVETAVAHLVGLQAQVPLDPYLALWSRLDSFDPIALGVAIETRSLVRTVVMRGTIHLVTAADALQLRPLMQPVLTAELRRHSVHGPALDGVDLNPVLAVGRAALSERPHTGPQLRAVMAEHIPGVDPAAAVYACRCLLPLVQVPPRGVWGKSAQVTLAHLEDWVGEPLASAPSIDAAVLRYLTAFGPATVADVATWSRLTGLRDVLERLRPRLRTFRDERGRELFDIPDAPRPDPGVPAPVRVLPEYDNLLLSHADRSRFGHGVPGATGPVKGVVLVDGFGNGVWHIEGNVIVVEHLPLTREQRAAVADEVARAAQFLQRGPDVRLVALDA